MVQAMTKEAKLRESLRAHINTLWRSRLAKCDAAKIEKHRRKIRELKKAIAALESSHANR